MRSKQKYTELESATQEMHTQTLHILLLVGKNRNEVEIEKAHGSHL
jgi:hypothetical protein